MLDIPPWLEHDSTNPAEQASSDSDVQRDAKVSGARRHIEKLLELRRLREWLDDPDFHELE